MRIGIFTDTYYPNINGVTSSIEREKQTYSAHGNEVILVGPHTCDVNHPVPIWRIYSTRDKRYSLVCPKSLFVRKLLPSRVDIVHIHTPFTFGILGLLSARKAGAKVVYTHHTNFRKYMHYVGPLNNALGLYLCNEYIRWFCNQADFVVAPSKNASQLLTDIGVSRDKISVLSTPLDNIYLLDRQMSFTKQYDVLFVGRLSREKSIDLLVRVYKRLGERNPERKLAIVGDGVDRAHVLNSLGHLVNKTVIYLGEIAKQRLIEAYRASKVLFAPSTSETQGLTLQEAWSQGVPVLAVDCAQTREFISHGHNGWLLPPTDSVIAEALEMLLTFDTTANARYRENCYSSVADYLPQKWYVKFCSIVGARI